MLSLGMGVPLQTGLATPREGGDCHLQLGLEDHNQDGEGHTHCDSIGQAQEE